MWLTTPFSHTKVAYKSAEIYCVCLALWLALILLFVPALPHFTHPHYNFPHHEVITTATTVFA